MIIRSDETEILLNYFLEGHFQFRWCIQTFLTVGKVYKLGKFVMAFACKAFLAFFLAGLINAQHSDYSSKISTFKANFIQSSKYCSNIYNTSLVEIIPMFRRNNDAGNSQAMCFLFCMLQRYQMMDKRGVIHTDKVESFLDSIPDSKFKSSLKSNKDKCSREDAQNQCQKAYKFSTCFYRNAAAKKAEN